MKFSLSIIRRTCWSTAAALFVLLPLSASAQTGPLPQDPPVSSWSAGNVILTVQNSTPARTYFMQWSNNLEDWIYLPWMDIGGGNDLAFSPSITASSRNFFQLVYTDSTSTDLDNDGLLNELEVENHGTDPLNPDSDGDGMPDGWEVTYSLNPLSAADAALDSDPGGGDGLTNFQEYQLGTHPKKRDTDDDGLNDNVEVNAGDDPTRFNMPEFTLVSATRQAVLRETIERPAGMTVVREAHSTANGRGTSEGVHASRTFHLANPGTSPTFNPWSMNSAANSAWGMGTGIPAPVVPMETHDLSTPLFASRKEKMHGDGDFIAVPGVPNAEECRNITRDGAIVERTVRVKAARAMPVAWSIPYTRSTRSPNPCGTGLGVPHRSALARSPSRQVKPTATP